MYLMANFVRNSYLSVYVVYGSCTLSGFRLFPRSLRPVYDRLLFEKKKILLPDVT